MRDHLSSKEGEVVAVELRASNHGGKARRSAGMPERTNSGLRGLPRIKTSVAQGSEHVPLLNAEHREKKSGGVSKYVVPAIGGACRLISPRLVHPPRTSLEAFPRFVGDCAKHYGVQNITSESRAPTPRSPHGPLRARFPLTHTQARSS